MNQIYNDGVRRSGRTSNQMLMAPVGAVFVWCNGAVGYPMNLANHLKRSDLVIVNRDWLLDTRQSAGRRLTGVVIDHACELSTDEWQCLELVRTRIY